MLLTLPTGNEFDTASFTQNVERSRELQISINSKKADLAKLQADLEQEIKAHDAACKDAEWNSKPQPKQPPAIARFEKQIVELTENIRRSQATLDEKTREYVTQTRSALTTYAHSLEFVERAALDAAFAKIESALVELARITGPEWITYNLLSDRDDYPMGRMKQAVRAVPASLRNWRESILDYAKVPPAGEPSDMSLQRLASAISAVESKPVEVPGGVENDRS